jgi:hypothetical protein
VAPISELPVAGNGRSAAVGAGNTSLSSPWVRRPANWKLPTKGADHGDRHCNHRSPAVERRKARRPKVASQTQGDMGDSHMTPNCQSMSRSRYSSRLRSRHARRYPRGFPILTESRGLSFSKPHPRITAPVNSSVCPDCGFLGSSVGIGPVKLWYPYATTDEGHTDLPTDK